MAATNYTPDQLAEVDIKAGWPLPEVAQIVAVQLSESGGDPNVVGWDSPNGETDTYGTGPGPSGFTSYDTGLSQINSSSNPNASAGTYDESWIASMEDPETNAAQALKMYNDRGWEPWQGDSAIKTGANFSTGEQAVNDVTDSKVASISAASQGQGGSGNGDVSSTSTSGGSGGSSSSGATANYTGLAGFLQDMQGVLSPQGPGVGTVDSILSLGTADVASSVEGVAELLVTRALFTIMFMGLAYLGVKTITGGSGQSISIINTAQRQQTNTTQRINANTAASAEARRGALVGGGAGGLMAGAEEAAGGLAAGAEEAAPLLAF